MVLTPLAYYAVFVFKVLAMTFKLNLHTDTVQQAALIEPLVIVPETSLRKTFELLRQHHIGCALICRDGVLVGIFTERDALRLMAKGIDFEEPVATVMSPQPETIQPDTTIAHAIRRILQAGHRRLPIIDAAGCPCRMLKVTGIVRYLVEYVPEAIYNLPPQPHAQPGKREGA